MSCICGLCNPPQKNPVFSRTNSQLNQPPINPSFTFHRRSVSKVENRRRYLNQITQNQNTLPSKKSLYTLKDKFRCIFCGGKNCPNEDYRRNKNSSIVGLNCDLIDNSIYASQRPSNVLIKKYNLIQVFKEKNIGLIINVQRPGEHPYCGPNTLDINSGYSYTPSLFSTEGINVKLYGWKDMDVPDSLYFMLDIIKEMIFTVEKEGKKVLVHCHAGKGRTGIVIACYLIYKYHICAQDAAAKVREKRKGAIENKDQLEYCKKCGIGVLVISELREIFTKVKKDVFTFIKHQNDLSPKSYNNQNNYETSYIPLIIAICLNRILELKKNNTVTNILIYKALNGSFDVSDENYANINSIIQNINNGNWVPLKSCDDVIILSEILFIWLDDCVKACIFPGTIQELYDNNKKLFSRKSNFLDLIIDFKKLNMETITEMYEFMKNILKKYEWENFKFFSNFLRDVYPIFTNDKNELKNEYIEYKRMIEKIAIFILGYNIDILYDNEVENKSFDFDNISENKEKYFQNVQMTILILKFLRDTSIKRPTFEDEYIGMIDVNKLLNFDSMNNSKEISNKEESNIEKMLNLNNRTIEQEKELFCIYQKLKNHFEKIPGRAVSDNYLNDFSKYLERPFYDEKSDYNTFKINIQECERESISSSGINSKINNSNIYNKSNLKISNINSKLNISNNNSNILISNENIKIPQLKIEHEDKKENKKTGIIKNKNVKLNIETIKINTNKPSFPTQIISKKLKKISFFVENDKENNKEYLGERKSEIPNIPPSYLFINNNINNISKRRSTAILKSLEKSFLSNKNKTGIFAKDMIQIPKDIYEKFQGKSSNTLKVKNEYYKK